jgi:hypothetical protein
VDLDLLWINFVIMSCMTRLQSWICERYGRSGIERFRYILFRQTKQVLHIMCDICDPQMWFAGGRNLHVGLGLCRWSCMTYELKDLVSVTLLQLHALDVVSVGWLVFVGIFRHYYQSV